MCVKADEIKLLLKNGLCVNKWSPVNDMSLCPDLTFLPKSCQLAPGFVDFTKAILKHELSSDTDSKNIK